MKFKALVLLDKKTKAAVQSFLMKTGSNKFELENPYEELLNTDELISKLPAHYMVSEDEEIIAYGEMQCVEDGSMVFAEFEGEGKAGSELIAGMLREVKKHGFELMLPSLQEDDGLLLLSGMKCKSVDYMLTYEDKTISTYHELPKGEEFFDEESEENEGILHGIADAEGYIICSCIVNEYDESVCISDVFTDEDHRRKGYATILINNIISVFGEKSIMLHVFGENEGAISLYKKLGFVVKERLYTYTSEG